MKTGQPTTGSLTVLSEGAVPQLHNRFSHDQVAFLFQAYAQGLMSRAEVQEALDIAKTRFFVLWKKYREDPDAFSVAYQRISPRKISPAAEAAIERELFREKELVEDPALPFSGYNYSALRDRLKKQGITVRRFEVRLFVLDDDDFRRVERPHQSKCLATLPAPKVRDNVHRIAQRDQPAKLDAEIYGPEIFEPFSADRHY